MSDGFQALQVANAQIVLPSSIMRPIIALSLLFALLPPLMAQENDPPAPQNPPVPPAPAGEPPVAQPAPPAPVVTAEAPAAPVEIHACLL